MDVDSDTDHCGACANACREAPNVQSASCVASTCVPTCEAGFGDCDAEAPGCETNTSTDSDHCGGCGVACRPDQICLDGSCVCPPDHKACGGQCRPLLTDVEHCGDCGVSCVDQPNALSGQCLGGSCAFVCQDDWADCDPTKAGCETHLPTDLAHCGACTNACRPNEACLGGDCVCPPELTDCASACTDLEVDPSNCGACEHTCEPGQVCEEFTCYEPCPADERHCGGVCFDLQSSVESCGSCGTNCNDLPHVLGASCHQGGCRFGCQIDWGDCNEDPADGCETDLSSTDVHCGECGKVCVPDQHCAGATCACDDERLTNCEGACVDTTSDPKNCGSCGNECGIRCEASDCLDVALIPRTQGVTHTCAIDSKGAVHCWGQNDVGQLGFGGAGEAVLRPVRVPLPGPAADVTTSWYNTLSGVRHSFTCARTAANGEVYCWGSNLDRQIKDDDTPFYATPVKKYRTPGEDEPLQVAQVAVSTSTACAILEDEGKVACWGSRFSGQTGNNSQVSGKSPYPVFARDPDDPEDANKVFKNVVRIAGGSHHFCALTAAHEVYCSGRSAGATTSMASSVAAPLEAPQSLRSTSCWTALP